MNKNQLRELLNHGTPAFPVAMYNNFFEEDTTVLAPLHYHNEFELFLATKGDILVQLEDTSYILKEGEGIFINSDLLHTITANSAGKHSFIALVFDASFICSKYEVIYSKYILPVMSGEITVFPMLPDNICKQITDIFHIFTSEEIGYELQIKNAVLSIFTDLLKHSASTDISIPNAKSQLIKTVLNYIDENYADNITLQSMADSAHISREYLCRIFGTMSDVSPIVYLNRYRVRQSTLLLTNTDKTISEIATLCGFNGSSYYNKMFLRFIGCTPKEYRKKYT